MNRQVPKTMDS